MEPRRLQVPPAADPPEQDPTGAPSETDEAADPIELDAEAEDQGVDPSQEEPADDPELFADPGADLRKIENWPEADQPHLRAAQARTTRYEQELASKKAVLDALEALPGFDPEVFVREIGALSQDPNAYTPPQQPFQAPQTPFQAPPTVPQQPYGNNGAAQAPYGADPRGQQAQGDPLEAAYANDAVIRQGLDLLNDPNGIATEAERYAVQTAIDNRKYSIYQNYVQSQREQEQARSNAWQQQQARSQALAQQTTRLQADPRFAPLAKDPLKLQAASQFAVRLQIPLDQAFGALYPDDLILIGRSSGVQQGETNARKRQGASLPTGKPGGGAVPREPVAVAPQKGASLGDYWSKAKQLGARTRTT